MELMKICISVDGRGRASLPGKEATLAGGLEEMEHICPKLILNRNETGIVSGLPGTQEDGEEDDDLALPAEWLEAAGIPEESDLEVLCIPGAILIKGADPLNNLPDDLKTLFAKLDINPDTVRKVMEQEGYFV